VVPWCRDVGFHLAPRAGGGLERRFPQWAFSVGAELSRVDDDPRHLP